MAEAAVVVMKVAAMTEVAAAKEAVAATEVAATKVVVAASSGSHRGGTRGWGGS